MVRATAFIVILALIAREAYGYGEPAADGRPVYQERANFNLINAVRIDPTNYKTIYMSGYSPSPAGILGSTYPPVPPVYLEPRLVASAFSHSQEMAAKNYFAHNSYDGTPTFTRIGTFYSCSGSKSENIAAGGSTAQSTNSQWLCDKVGSECAADGASGDGHRRNIMSSSVRSVGVGYAYNASSQYRHYWTQDFGGACTGQTSPVYSGSHYLSGTNIKFAAVYYSADGSAPSSANVVINGQSFPLSIELGAAGRASYAYTTTTQSGGCRSYYFQFGSVRYPDTGSLVTTTEGTCTAQFDASNGGGSTPAPNPTTAPTPRPATSAPTPATSAPTPATSAPTPATSAPGSTATPRPATARPATPRPATPRPATPRPATATPRPATSAPGSMQYIYQSGLHNGWTSYGNSGVTINRAASFGGLSAHSALLTNSGSTKFFWFAHAEQTNTWSTVKFSAASSSASTVLVYFNGGYYKTLSLTTAWQDFSFTMAQLGNPTVVGGNKQLVFQISSAGSTTLYTREVRLA